MQSFIEYDDLFFACSFLGRIHRRSTIRPCERIVHITDHVDVNLKEPSINRPSIDGVNPAQIFSDRGEFVSCTIKKAVAKSGGRTYTAVAGRAAANTDYNTFGSPLDGGFYDLTGAAGRRLHWVLQMGGQQDEATCLSHFNNGGFYPVHISIAGFNSTLQGAGDLQGFNLPVKRLGQHIDQAVTTIGHWKADDLDIIGCANCPILNGNGCSHCGETAFESVGSRYDFHAITSHQVVNGPAPFNRVSSTA